MRMRTGRLSDTYQARFALPRNDRVIPDPWGAVRHGWETLKIRISEMHIVLQLVIYGLALVAGVWMLRGLVVASNSSGFYHLAGAAWGALKFGIIGGIAGVLFVAFIQSIADYLLNLNRQPGMPVRSAEIHGIVLLAAAGIFVIAIGYGIWQGWTKATMSTSISEIVSDRASFDGEGVDVTGQIESYQQHVSRIGNRYVTAVLCDQQCIRVFEWGESDTSVTDTGWAEVWGTYRVANHVGDYSFANEIDAKDIASIQDPSTSSDNGP
jgi:hypothetical protein